MINRSALIEDHNIDNFLIEFTDYIKDYDDAEKVKASRLLRFMQQSGQLDGVDRINDVNLIDKLNRHELDFALIALPYDTDGFLVKELFDDEFWLVANETDPVFKNKEIQLNNKLTDRLLLLEEGNCLRDQTLKACKRSQLAKHDGIEATSLLTLVQMVESGLGIALLPEMAVKSGLLKQSQLLAKPLSHPAPKRKIALVARASTARIEEFNALVKVIKS